MRIKSVSYLLLSLFTLIILVSPSVINAQETALTTLRGQITDNNDASVGGAEIIVTNLETKLKRQTMSDERGNFTFADVPPGNSSISITKPGFAEIKREIRLTAGANALNFQMSVGAVAAVVNVETETARVELERVPGSTELVPRREIQEILATNLKDVLNFTPGVLAQPRYGSDETQFSVRGSGLRNNYHARGINILINGLPYGDADGFSDFETLEFLTAERVEIWKGANALRFGGNSAGGALNLVTETGETALPLEIRLQGGSFGAFKGYVSTGGKRGRFGYFLSLSDTELEGYREHSEQGRQRFFGNFNFALDEKTDFYADLVYANIAEKLPGSLNFFDSKTDPRRANPNNVAQDWGRFINYARGTVTRAARSPSSAVSAANTSFSLISQLSIAIWCIRFSRFSTRTRAHSAGKFVIATPERATVSSPVSRRKLP